MKEKLVLIIPLLFFLPPVTGTSPILEYSSYHIELITIDNVDVLLLERISYINYGRPVTLSLQKRIPAANVENISVADEEGSLPFSVQRIENFTVISFSTGWINTGEEYSLSISYVLTNWTRIVGGNYVVHMWGLRDFDLDCENFTIRVIGPPNSVPFISDPPAQSERGDPPSFLYSTTIRRGQSFRGFRAIFSKRTFYLVSLEYEIAAKNVKDFSLDLIFMNPFLDWQFSSLVSMNPTPSRIFFDDDGNLHGVFEFNRMNENRVHVRLFFDVSVHDPDIKQGEVGTVTDVPQELRQFMLPTEWWPSDHPTIMEISNQISRPGQNAFDLALSVMDFVRNRLSYEQQDVRRGPLWAIGNGLGDCSEYTDLFISISRATGLPARALYGWAYTAENFSPHAFAEVYLPGIGWQPVDPSWGDVHGNYFCKMDASHLVRLRRGRESSESWMEMRYAGEMVRVSEKIREVKILSPSEAAEIYISSSRTHLELARALVLDNLELRTKFFKAEQELRLAENSAEFDKIVYHSRLSITLSNEIILKSRQVKTEIWPWLFALPLTLLVLLWIYRQGRKRFK